MFPIQNRIALALIAFTGFALTACQQAIPSQALAKTPEEVVYKVSLTSQWTAQNFPLEYPPAAIVGGPHFSGLIGASHGKGFQLYQEGKQPSPGLERLSEEGKHDPLNQEIQAAIAKGEAGFLFESGPLRDFSQNVETTLQVNDHNSMVSVVAMIAPSPDWFAGARDIPLKEQGQWVQSRQVTLYAYDSGGDEGQTYKAPDMDNQPKKPTHLAKDNPHFLKDGKLVPVATLTFTRQ
ncbi:MAG TPA: spondin domain-containing protein [bacterium]|nr:spondin domain-containing protein [bacterium]